MVKHGDHKSVDYSEPPKTVCFLSRTSRHDELLAEVHTAMNTTEDHRKLTLFGRYPSMIPGGQVLFVSFPLTNNQSWHWFLEATLLFQPVHVYIVAEKKTTDDRNLKKKHRVGSSGCANDHILDGEEEDMLDDGRVMKIRRGFQGVAIRRHCISKASSSYQGDEDAVNGDIVAADIDTPATVTDSAAVSSSTHAVDTTPATITTPTTVTAPAAADTPATVTTPVVSAAPNAAFENEQKTIRLEVLLSQLTPRNSLRVLELVKDVNIDNVKSLVAFARMAYNKAVVEPAFCEMLVDICIALNCMLPGFTVDGKELNFARCLSNCCHKELQRGKEKLMLGNVKLITELYVKNLLDEGIVHSCIKKILWECENPEEEEIEALSKLMYRVGESMDNPQVKELTVMDMYFEKMTKLSNHPDFSSRVKQMLVHLVGLRNNKWEPKTPGLAMTLHVGVSKPHPPFTIKVKLSHTVLNMKAMIKYHRGYLLCQQRLLLADLELEDNRTLADYNVQSYSPILLRVL
ncbi:unnamed protein product [Cuscuta campestris]|uniref:Ubiquitin-like domain-containing protein n=1 Tax=Cuscuta campestris TaxID=132261 RepID=A0A484KEE7_9ASTE|nr:unnamed protein product [Cuscuta campestris]